MSLKMDWGRARLPKAWCDPGCNLCHECGEGVCHLNPQNQTSGMAAKSSQTKSQEDKLCLKTYSECLSDPRCQKFITEAKGCIYQKYRNKHQTDKKDSEASPRVDLFQEDLSAAKDASKGEDGNHPIYEKDPYSGIDRANSLGHQIAGKANGHGEFTDCSYTEKSKKAHSRGAFHKQDREVNIKYAVREALHQEFGKEAYARVEEELSKETYSIQDLQFLCDLLDISEKFNEICRRNIPFHELSSLIFETWATKNRLELNANHLKQILRSRPVFKPLLRILEESHEPPPARPPPPLPPRRRLFAESSPPAPPPPPRTVLPKTLTRPACTRPSRSRSPGLPPPRISLPPSSPPPLLPLPGVFEPLPRGAVSASRILQVESSSGDPVVIILCRLLLWGASWSERVWAMKGSITRMVVVTCMPLTSKVSLRLPMSGSYSFLLRFKPGCFMKQETNLQSNFHRISASWCASGKTYALVGPFQNQFSSIDDLVDFYSRQQLPWLPIKKDLRVLPSQLTDSRCELYSPPTSTSSALPSMPDSICSVDSRSMIDLCSYPSDHTVVENQDK